MKKIYDSWDLNYKTPFGAVIKGEQCNFALRIPHTTKLDCAPVMVTFRTGFKERYLPMTRIAIEKDCMVYKTSYSPRNIGIHNYYFFVTINGKRHYIKKFGCHNAIFDDGDLFQLTVYDNEYTTADFVKGGIMYQIFPDRFYNSGKKHENIPSDRILRDDWGGLPLHYPDKNNKWNTDYFGGDLEGIRQKLPYIRSLGVTCIYLNPIFESHENHHYNTGNYMKIDPCLGTNEEFKNLCEKAKEIGIRIILDGVFSHTGADSIYFNKFNRYDSVGAYNSKESPYYDWYTFEKYPDKYESWWGINLLPNVKENNKKYTEFICGENGVLEYWIKQGASGYRLDVADELPDEFLDNLRTAVKGMGEDNLIIGEVWEDASNKESYGVRRRYLLGAQLDSVMNYPFKDAILDYVKGGSVFSFRHKIMTILENYPKPSIDTLMNSLSTHDTQRAINFLGSNESVDGKDKDWMSRHKLSEDEYKKGKNLLKCAMVLQFFLPGVPCIYYGDEVGLQGDKDPFNRLCYPWGNEDTELLDFIKDLAEIRNSSKTFIDGKFSFLMVNEKFIAFARTRSENKKAVIILLNRTNEVIRVPKNLAQIKNYKKFILLHGQYNDEMLVVHPYDYAAVKVEI